MKKTKILKTISSTAFGKYFTVKDVLVEVPNGTQAHYYIREAEDFSVIIPFLTPEICVMTKQYRVGSGKFSIEFPMGVASGKTPLEAAQTELKQETGYTAESFEKIGSFYLANSSSPQQSHVFVARSLKSGMTSLEPTEDIETLEMKWDDVADKIKEGEIFDGPTIAAFGLFKAIQL